LIADFVLANAQFLLLTDSIRCHFTTTQPICKACQSDYNYVAGEMGAAMLAQVAGAVLLLARRLAVY
jgi:uncharacterized protein (DUF983 family)